MAAAAAEATQGPSAAEVTVPDAEEPRETRKLFVGGIPSAAMETDLLQYFARFGEVRSVTVMRDRETGHGRGFGFVEFDAEDAAARALGDGDKPRHYICGRQVDVKRARTRPPRNQDNQPPAADSNFSYESKKVFVGGLKEKITEEDFKAYFSTFGTVTDAVVIYDGLTNKSRGFGFVTFDSEEAVDTIMRQKFHIINGMTVEVKIAIPKEDQYYRNGRGRGGRPFGPRGSNYEAPMYQPYNARYGVYGGYMPQLIPAPGFYPAQYFPYAGYPYVNGAVMANVQGMTARRAPPMYVTYAQDPAASVELQEDLRTASMTTKLENMKLGSQ